MAESRQFTPEQVGGEAFPAWLVEGEGVPVSLLSALLDAHLLFQEDHLSPGVLRPLFEARWPGASQEEAWERLCRYGLVEPVPGASFAVPGELRLPLATALENHLCGRTLSLPCATISWWDLIAGFSDHCQRELRLSPDEGAGAQVWAGTAFRISGRRQLILLRPDLLALRAHPEAHLLVLCSLPAAVARTAAASFIGEPALRNRLALYDVEGGDKANLTRGELVVHFERYLLRTHSLRMVPSPALTESLTDSRLLNLHKG